MVPAKKVASSSRSRSRSATPAKDAVENGTPQAGTLFAFFSKTPSPAPSVSSKRRLSDASATSNRSTTPAHPRSSVKGKGKAGKGDGGALSDSKNRESGKSKAKGKAKAVDPAPTVIDLSESPPASPTRHRSPSSSSRRNRPSTSSAKHPDDDEDVFALPFAPAAPIPQAAFDVPAEGDDFIRPPEAEGDDDDDAWEVETVGSETLCGRSVAGEPAVWDDSQEDESGLRSCEAKEGSSPGGEGPPKCPICDTLFSGLVITEAQKHVNACLDRLSGGSSVGDGAVRGDSPAPAKKARLSPSPGPSSREPRSGATPLRPLSAHIQSFAAPRAELGKGKSKGSAKNDAPARNPDAFTALMMGHAEDKAWKAAEKDHQRSKPRGPRFSGKREAPFYKIMEGMPIAVDAFRYGAVPNIQAYFLTHAHADHYTNLSEKWEHGPIYCSITTGNLIVHNLGVQRKWVRSLPNDVPTVVEGGVTVTVLNANHCPGSSLFLFEGPHSLPSSPYSKTPERKFRYLHCGDFRASPVHLRHPAVRGKKVDIVYLDTTYLNPKYCFPAQEQVINACSELVKERLAGDVGALRRGRGGDGSMERAEKMMAGWLDASTVKKEESVKREPSVKQEEKVKQEEQAQEEEDGRMDDDDGKQIPVMECSDLVKEEDADEPNGRDNDGSTGNGGQGPQEEDQQMCAEEDDDKMMWEALEADLPTDERPPSLSTPTGGSAPHPSHFLPSSAASDSTADTKPELKPNARGERFCVLVGTYSIGKERIVKGIAQTIGSKIYCNAHKAAIFRCIDDPELHALLTDDPKDAVVHVTNLFAIKKKTLEDYLESFGGHFTKIIGLRPTGWTFKSEGPEDKMPSIAKTLARDSKRGFSPAYLYPQRDSTEQCQAYGVPYSEHSSFFELTCFCISLEWVRIIPTVNCGNPTSRAKMRAWFDRWQAERKRRKENREPLFIEPRTDHYW